MNSKYLGVEENVLLDNEVNMFNIYERIYKNNEKIYIFSKLRNITSICSIYNCYNAYSMSIIRYGFIS